MKKEKKKNWETKAMTTAAWYKRSTGWTEEDVDLS